MHGPWDWLYTHHRQLVAVIAVAAVVFAIALTAAVRRRTFWNGVAWVLPPGLLLIATLAAWTLADRWSLASDIERRVDDVTAILPASAARTAVTAGDNFRTESYTVPGDAATISGQVRSAAHAMLAGSGQVYDLPAQGDAPAEVEVAFTGRNGCDGSVEVFIDFAAAQGATSISVLGHCED